MEWKLGVRRRGITVGSLSCTGDGLRTSFRLDCTQGDQRSLEKLWLVGKGRFLLGTPIPVGGRLTLQRMVTNRQLEHLRPITGAILSPVDGAGDPGLPDSVRDQELRALLSGTGYLIQEDGDSILLSWLWKPGEELPVAALFTRMAWREGRLWLRLRNGWPENI